MTWTAGSNRATGDVITAAQWNTFLGSAGNITLTAPGVVTTQGDTVYATAANTLARLAKGTSRQSLSMNSGATAPEWVASPASTLTTTGDLLYASGANTIARLAKGTSRQSLSMNSGATAPEWVASPASTLTTTGDILYASGANTIARLAASTDGYVLTATGAGSAPAWEANPTTGSTVPATTAGDILYASSSNTLAGLAKGTSRQGLTMNSGATAPEWTASPSSLMTTTGDILIASGANTPARLAASTDGHVLTSTGAGSAPAWEAVAAGPTRVTYTGSQVVDNSITMVDATGMSFAVAANSTYYVKLWLKYNGWILHTAGGIRVDFTYPTGTTFDFLNNNNFAGIYSPVGWGNIFGWTLIQRVIGTADDKPMFSSYYGQMITVGASGTIQMRFAQSGAAASKPTTLLAGTYLEYELLA